MSIRHEELCDVIINISRRGYYTKREKELLKAYAEPADGFEIEDTLDNLTRDLVERVTDKQVRGTPRAAARAILRYVPSARQARGKAAA